MTQSHDNEARLEMLRSTIERNRHQLVEHTFERDLASREVEVPKLVEVPSEPKL